MEIHVGCSGWYYRHWEKIFYPPRTDSRLWFGYYCASFQTVELNAPFYRWPKGTTVKQWRRQAPAGFRYSIKVNQAITHERRMVRTKKLIQEFQSLADVLAEKMGCFLFQFPPSYRYTPARLRSITTQLPGSQLNAIEFRHKSWWRPGVYRAFKKAGLVFCSVSAPRLPDELIVTGETLYLRLHGPLRWYRWDYSDAELMDWAQRIVSSGAKTGWIYFNNDHEGFAVKNALRLKRILRRLTGAPRAENPSVG